MTGEKDPAGPRSRRRRPVGLVAVLLAVLVLLAGLGLRQIALSGEAARQGVATALAGVTGQSVTIGGASGFSLLPVARLSLSDVRIGTDGGGLRLSVESLTADLDLWQALIGRTRIERLVLIRPAVSAPAEPSANASIPKSFGPLLSRLHGVKEIVVRDGMLGASGTPAIVTAANLVLSWPAEASAARLSGAYAWNGQTVEIALDVASPRDWLERAPSAIDLQLTSPQLELAFEGQASQSGRLDGRVRTSLPSLGRSLRWLTHARQNLPEIGPLDVAADLSFDGRRLELADAEVAIGGVAGHGALDVVFPEGRRPSLGGTLAFETVDFDPIAAALAPFPGTAIEAARPIPVGFVDRLDMDLRVSAQTGRIGPLALSDLAGTVRVRDGKATLDIGDAGLLGGRGQMRVGLDTRTAPPALKGSASLHGVEAGGLLAAFGLPSGIVTGLADVAVSAQAPVVSWAGILERHRMEATLSARSGSVAGLDPLALRQGGTNAYDGTLAASLPFATLRAEIASRGARMELKSLRLAGDAGTLDAAGLLADASGAVDLAGTFEPAGAAGTEAALTKPKPLGATMRGFWARPVLVTSAAPAAE